MSESFTLLFAFGLCAQVACKLYLAMRQQRHMAAHRHAVPAAFASRISLAAHQKAADYNAAQLAEAIRSDDRAAILATFQRAKRARDNLYLD